MGLQATYQAFPNSPRHLFQGFAYVCFSNFHVLTLFRNILGTGQETLVDGTLSCRFFLHLEGYLLKMTLCFWKDVSSFGAADKSSDHCSVRRQSKSITKIEMEKSPFVNKTVHVDIVRLSIAMLDSPLLFFQWYIPFCESCIPTARHALLGFLSFSPTQQSGR